MEKKKKDYRGKRAEETETKMKQRIKMKNHKEKAEEKRRTQNEK